MTLENIHPITFRKYTKHSIKMFRNKITCSFNNMETGKLFIKKFSALHLNIFVVNVFNKRTS